MSISSSSATSTSRTKQYDLNAIGVFQSACDEKSERLVGHIPVEISQLINYFISAANTNTIIAVVTGKRKREIGLVVPAKYFAYTNNKKNAEILMKKLLEKKYSRTRCTQRKYC